jgi:NADPH2:quinone reductase
MRALVCRAFGAPEALRVEEAPDPGEPGPGQIRLRVLAAGVNFADLLMIGGSYQVKPALPFTPGLEAAGVIEALGPDVLGLAVGERVMAIVDHGGFAETAIAKASAAFPIPEGMDDAIAGGFPIAYGTSYLGLAHKARLQAGEVALVHGAAGGVGLTAVEIANALGAVVVATAGGKSKCEIALAHGARHAIDTQTQDVREQVKALVGGVDVVYDPVGGALFEASLRVANWDARMVIVGFAAGEAQKIPANILLVKNVSALGFYFGSYRKHRPDLVRDAFAGLESLWKRGALRPLVSSHLPLGQFALAFDLIRSRRATGKVVLRP